MDRLPERAQGELCESLCSWWAAKGLARCVLLALPPGHALPREYEESWIVGILFRMVAHVSYFDIFQFEWVFLCLHFIPPLYCLLGTSGESHLEIKPMNF